MGEAFGSQGPTSAPFATNLPAGMPARSAAARLHRRTAPAAHVGHLPPAGTARRARRPLPVRPGRRDCGSRRGSPGRWPSRCAPQLGAEPQAQQQRGSEQTPAQGAAAPAGWHFSPHPWGWPRAALGDPAQHQVCTRDLAPGARAARSRNSPQGRLGLELGPASQSSVRESLCVTLSCPACMPSLCWGRGAPRPVVQGCLCTGALQASFQDFGGVEKLQALEKRIPKRLLG